MPSSTETALHVLSFSSIRPKTFRFQNLSLQL
uniref:Uncharacterized protein n=1 Tax=Arundo donax TaxID=35708 RepID=A0A0A9AHX1_ARUDO